MRRFVLDRAEDISGSSGVGYVAEGVEFTNGTVAMRWRTDLASTAIYDTIGELEAIHGHDGATQIRWIDGPMDLHCDAPGCTPGPSAYLLAFAGEGDHSAGHGRLEGGYPPGWSPRRVGVIQTRTAAKTALPAFPFARRSALG